MVKKYIVNSHQKHRWPVLTCTNIFIVSRIRNASNKSTLTVRNVSRIKNGQRSQSSFKQDSSRVVEPRQSLQQVSLCDAIYQALLSFKRSRDIYQSFEFGV